MMKKKILFFCLLCYCNLSFGQRVPLRYLPDIQKKNSVDELLGRLYKLDDSVSLNEPICFGGIGYFSFTVTSKGNIKLNDYHGYLPMSFVENIKRNILNTKGHWALEMEDGEYVDSKPVYFIYVLNMRFCEGNWDLFRENEVSLGALLKDWRNSLPADLVEYNTGYLLKVAFYYVLR